MTTRRCWRYLHNGCRQHAVNTKRIGDHAIAWCANPDHEPQRKAT